MGKLRGDWFHSRTGSQLSELAAIQLLVESSKRAEFIKKRWGAGRKGANGAWLYAFAATAKVGEEEIRPSTMQTKIRNWIRLGFLKDSKLLPLKWTELGLLWIDAVENGRGQDANLLYRLIIANAISVASLIPDGHGFDETPVEERLIVKFLINEMKKNSNELSRAQLSELIDGDTTRQKSFNYSYWVTDLIQSGLFIKNDDGGLKFSKMYPEMLSAIVQYKPSKLSATQIKEFPLAYGSPFREALLIEFKKYGSIDLLEAVRTISNYNITLTNEQLEVNSYVRLKRNSKWANEIKNIYNYKCVLPNCDAEGTLFIEAAHIMPFSVHDELILNKHRDDLENGLAMCLSCHKMFDAGLFTFDETGEIVPSKFIYSSDLVNNLYQTNVIRVINSGRKKIQTTLGNSINKLYVSYHRENIFLGE
ncbi:HNH endonuclease [Fundicoccus sp. Sow4_F4]|uniref:HNH endonuclease n=1 Tax=Fundicoccus sp. Sow4_F4 TaxID=3438783 RepID=UPI003F91CC11